MTPSEWAGFLPREDSVLRECVIRIAGVGIQGLAHGLGSEITAHQLVLRLSELLGGKAPKWHNDNGIFAPFAIKQIVEYIDARLCHPIYLEEITSLAGLSPSHCAKKFRCSEGMSLGRFVNRRRWWSSETMKFLWRDLPSISVSRLRVTSRGCSAI